MSILTDRYGTKIERDDDYVGVTNGRGELIFVGTLADVTALMRVIGLKSRYDEALHAAIQLEKAP